MSDYLAIAIVGAVVIIAAILLWQIRELKRLKQDYRLLADQLHSNKEDVAGLCSAAVAVDQHLAAHDVQLNGLLNLASTSKPIEAGGAAAAKSDQEPQEYEMAIQKIRRGAGVDELVRECGLTRDEAVLLIRLHGGKR